VGAAIADHRTSDIRFSIGPSALAVTRKI